MLPGNEMHASVLDIDVIEREPELHERPLRDRHTWTHKRHRCVCQVLMPRRCRSMSGLLVDKRVEGKHRVGRGEELSCD